MHLCINIRKCGLNGEHACPVVFWSQKEVAKEATEEKDVKRILRYYSVFNIDQCISIPEERIPELYFNDNVAISTCEAVVENMPQKPKIQHKGQEAFYNPPMDVINMPKLKTFWEGLSYCMFFKKQRVLAVFLLK